MSEFAALDTGEALVAGQKKNEDLACPEGGDAAAIAGAAIAGVALLGAAAVAAATSSMVSNGIGQVTDAAQAAATDLLTESQANANALLDEARANALEAIGFGPGGEGSAALEESQAQVDAAQQQALALAGEVRAGVDASIAEAEAAIAAGQAFIDDAIAQGQTLLADGQAALTTAVAGLIGQALGAVPPLPTALSSPTPGALPIPPLPVDVPIVSKVIPTEVSVPAANLAIPSPNSLAEGAVGGVATRFGVDAASQSPLQEAVLSRDEIDACIDERTQISEAMERMNTKWQELAQRISLSAPSQDTRTEGGLFTGGTTHSIRAFLLFEGGGSNAFINGVFGGATATAVNRRILLKGSFSADIREKLEIGPLAGSVQWQNLRDQVVNVAQFTGKCDTLPAVSSAVVAQEGLFDSTMQQLQDALESFVADNVIEEEVAEINRIVPLWETLTDILVGIENSSTSVSVTG